MGRDPGVWAGWFGCIPTFFSLLCLFFFYSVDYSDSFWHLCGSPRWIPQYREHTKKLNELQDNELAAKWDFAASTDAFTMFYANTLRGKKVLDIGMYHLLGFFFRKNGISRNRSTKTIWASLYVSLSIVPLLNHARVIQALESLGKLCNSPSRGPMSLLWTLHPAIWKSSDESPSTRVSVPLVCVDLAGLHIIMVLTLGMGCW